jgi:putative DNA primase/helicase
VSAADIIAGLGGNPNTGMAKCPAHDDSRASLHVSEGPCGALWYCHAGCSQEAVTEALQASGLIRAAGEKRPRVERRQRTGEVRSTLDIAQRIWRRHAFGLPSPDHYLRGRGITLRPRALGQLPPSCAARLRLRRFPTMVAPIVGPEGGLIGVQVTALTMDADAKVESERGARTTYGAMRGGYVQLAEIDPTGPLIIGEGVESTLAAMQISGFAGIAAISATNMTAIRPPAASEYIIAADNDDPGRQAAAALAERLEHESGKAVRIALPSSEGNDWNDRLKHAKAPDEEWREALAAKRPAQAPVRPLGMEDFMAQVFPQRQYLLKPWLTTTGLAMVYADSGVGKTRFVLSAAYAVARGAPFMDWSCEHQARVLFIDGELPGELLQQWLAELGPVLPPADFQILSHALMEAQGREMLDLGAAEGRQLLDKVIEAGGYELIVLDSVSTLVRSGVENDVESWRLVQQWALKHRQHGRAVLYLHHTGRSGKARGSSLREVVLDSALQFQAMPEESSDDETALKLLYTKHRHFFGRDAAPVLLHQGLVDGRIVWRQQAILPPNAERVREMHEEGRSNTEIARALNITKQRVGQIVRAL